MIPFERTFSAEQSDQKLLDKLKAEAPFIVGWMIQGAIEWQRRRLNDVPAVIRKATDSYKSEMDIIGQWLRDCCEQGANYEETSANLYASHRDWCELNGLRPPANNSFGRRIAERGFELHKTGHKRVWLGLKIISGADGADKRLF